MECKKCKEECIGETPCTKCKAKLDIKAVLKNIGIFIAAAIIFYWIGVVV